MNHIIKLFFLLLFFSSTSINGQNSMTISPIGPQEVIAGGQTTIFFSGVNGKSNGITFSSDDMPSFVSIEDSGNNEGRFIVNSQSSDVGVYDFHLNTSWSTKSASIDVHLEVKAPLGQVYYCDPENGSIDNTGDSESPWSTISEVFTSGKKFEDGDVILLRSGYHGTPNIKGYQTGPTYILPEANSSPTIRKINFGACSQWHVSGLVISPEVINTTSLDHLVYFQNTSLRNTLSNCEIYGIQNSEVWDTDAKWYANCPFGVVCDGKYSNILNNYIYNTDFPVHLQAEYASFNYNTIDKYARDAMRGLADHVAFCYNVIKNPVVDDYDTVNHDDAFQSWTTGFDSRIGFKIIGNQVFSVTHSGIPMISSVLQGIVNFDGFSEDWVIANNLIVVDQWHAISLLGAKNCKIVNNTIVKNPLDLFQFGDPWIAIWPTKATAGSDPSTGNLVRNNILPTYSTQGGIPGSKDFNLQSNNYTAIYQDYFNWDFRPKISTAINSGSTYEATTYDIEGKLRDSSPDIGCYEVNASIVDYTPPTGTINISSTLLSPSSIELSWDGVNDENGIAFYIIHYDNDTKMITTQLNSTIIKGLRPDTEYEFIVEAYDNGGNKTTSSPFTLTTSDNTGTMEVFYIPADHFDQQVLSNKKLMWVGMQKMDIGGRLSNDASAIIPFKLPRLRDGKEVMSVNLELELDAIEGNPSFMLDLYGLKFRDDADVVIDDFYQGSADPDMENTLINKGFISQFTPEGLLQSNFSTNNELKNYVQNTYDIGGKVNDYIFLRLNSDISNAATNSYYSISSADAIDTKIKPCLKIITYEPNGTKPVEIKTEMLLFPNPTSSQEINLNMEGFDPNENVVILIHNSMGAEIFSKNVVVGNKGENLLINLPNMISGSYFVTILGEHHFSNGKLIINTK